MPVAAPSAGATLAEWLAYQEQVHPRNIELGLDRVGAVAARLRLPGAGITTLTVAGTNGKGSSATLAALIYREAGYRVGLYTSPHLLRYNERVAIDGVDANDAALCLAFEAIEQVRGDTALTYFEYGTLAALWLFRERAVQVQVLEVGLGGRLDAVNLVDADAALVTSIGIDHTDWLGPDRESIGREKAHVFRAGRPAVCADPDPPASIAAHARGIGASLQQLGREFFAEQRAAGTWQWRSGRGLLRDLPLPGLRGPAQVRNAAGVIAAVQSLQDRCAVPEAAIRAALPKLSLRGRFECVDRCIYDVAHNAEAGAVLAEQLARRADGARRVFVLGMLADKPVETFCAAIAPAASRVYCASLPPPRGLDGDSLRRCVQSTGIDAVACADVRDALTQARVAAGEGGEVVVTGSFLTVAAALADEG